MKGYGLLQVYTGDGKGKTTAALGVILRASGYDAKTIMFQFMKDDPGYGEFKAQKYLPGFELVQVGRENFVDFKNPDPIDVQMMSNGWELAKKAIKSEKYDIVVLDEITICLATNLLPLTETIDFLKKHKKNTEIIITGRYAPPELLKIADLITEMKNERHYFFSGKESRNGIDH